MENTKIMNDTRGLKLIASCGNYLFFVYLDEDCDRPAYGVKKFHKYSFSEVDALWGIDERSPEDALLHYQIYEDNEALHELNKK